MRPDTKVAWKLESVGKPDFNETKEGTMIEYCKASLEWASKVHMGTHIRITIARNMSELIEKTEGKSRVSGNEFENLFAQFNTEQNELTREPCKHESITGAWCNDCGINVREDEVFMASDRANHLR